MPDRRGRRELRPGCRQSGVSRRPDSSRATSSPNWAGIRPLIAPASVRKERLPTPRGTTRSACPKPGWIDVAGGKLTTYRLMAEQTVDLIGRASEAFAAPCRTADEPLIDAAEAAGASGIIPPAVTREAVERFCMREWARDVDDVMLRRTSWRQYHRRQSRTRSPGKWVRGWLTFLTSHLPDGPFGGRRGTVPFSPTDADQRFASVPGRCPRKLGQSPLASLLPQNGSFPYTACPDFPDLLDL